MTTTATDTPAPEFWIEWDMGDYGPFATEAEARAYQRTHALTGSTIARH